jgi:ubiquinol-cytochrome c reductase cytochrome c subunit
MKRRPTIGLLALLIGLWIVGLAEAQPQSGIVRPTTEPTTPSLQLGSQLYAGNCASCHGIDGSGITAPRRGAGDILGAGPSLRGVGARAADFYLRTGYMPLSSIHDQPGPDRVLLSDKEIRSLVAYVASLGTGPGIPHPDPGAGSISEGLHQFTLRCAGCHQVVARGGFVTGAVVPPLQSATATQIAEAVRIGPYLMPRFSTRQISESQLNSIIAYVLSTRHPDNRGGWGIGNLGPIPEGLVAWWIAIPLLITACMAMGRRLHK